MPDISSEPTSTANKRAHDGDDTSTGDGGVAQKKQKKLFPIFAQPGVSTSQSDVITMPFRWDKALGPTGKRTCLHGVHLIPKPSSKVAMFDLDGTLIKSNFDRGKAKGRKTGPLEWEWWKAVVPVKLKAVHDAGYSIAIISNQNYKEKQITEWKAKIPLIAKSIPDIPFHIFAATAKDGFRKPMPGMWRELERIFAEEGVTIDKTTAFYVGDAAGRADDFAGTDRKFAINVGIDFHTPEAYFLDFPEGPFRLQGFHPASLKPTTPNPPPAIPDTPELVVFVGMPCLGKSTFYRTHFALAGYLHVNQDTLGSRPKCIKATEEALKEGKSCVVDNTNRDIKTRKLYVDLAKKMGIPARCFLFDGSKELAWHNNLFRAYNLPASISDREPARDNLPYLAFSGFATNYEEPTASEGFAEIRTVCWRFEGDEEERRHWNMWLQIDGK